MFFASSVLDLPTPYIYSYFGKAFFLLRYAESRKQDKCRIPCLFGTMSFSWRRPRSAR